MNQLKNHWEQQASEYDRFVLDLVPYYKEMIEALVWGIPFAQDTSFNVLELGCGTGFVTERLKNKFPQAKVMCFDLAKNMIEIARMRLKEFDGIKFSEGDFTEISFDHEYDVVISSLAMHHVRKSDVKKELFKKIYNCLKSGGVFINADVVLGADEHGRQVNRAKWIEYMKRNVSLEEIEKKWIPRHEEIDSPFPLMDEINWLAQMNFVDVDVIWRYYNVAVYKGKKQ